MYIIRASTDRMRRQVYRLRYDVYCLEKEFEFPSQDLCEMDDDDDRSVHLLIMYTEDCAIGTCRMILPQQGRPLPTERVVNLGINTDNMGEISRMAILPRFRHKTEMHFEVAKALVQIGVDYNLTGAIGLLFPAFIRHWRRFNVNFKPIGGLIEHHGVRQPCYILTKDVIADLGQHQAA